MAQLGKCTNVGNCSKADASELITLIDGVEFVCPECNKNLNPVQPASSNKKLWPLLGGILGVATLVAGFLYSGDTTKVPSTTPPKTPITNNSSNPSQPNTLLPPNAVVNHQIPEDNKPAPAKEIILQVEQSIKQGMGYINLAQETKSKAKRLEGFNNAVAELTRAIDLVEPKNNCLSVTNAYMNRGLIYLHYLNKPNLALEDLQQAEVCDSQNSYVQYNLASYYAMQKQEDLALRAFDKALELGLQKKYTQANRSFCEELVKDNTFKGFKNKTEFKVILEKYKIPCYFNNTLAKLFFQ